MTDAQEYPVGVPVDRLLAAAPVAAAESSEQPPGAPTPPQIDPTTREGRLVANVTDALLALPGYWSPSTFIEGMLAGDLFSLNSALGGTIEVQVVQTLNRIREVWDPNDEWQQYRFVRNSSCFPDVRLVGHVDGRLHTAIGIELKGWYLLAREGEPSFRYKVTPAACADVDLLAIVPWHLSNVVAGRPVVYEPWIASAKYVAESRNFWWEHERQAVDPDSASVRLAPGSVSPYPESRAQTNDRAVNDGGNNFGRVARIGTLLDDYRTALFATEIVGIPAASWLAFLRVHANDPDTVLQRLNAQVQRSGRSAETAGRIEALLRELTELLS